ncbi:DUF397 domain-containing protein [Micromonospora musae]|uniref:DUF397 domain-containing protein n=1 Tax=Micromonospora musae TaxID=1894970 RepID=UPI0018F6AE26|nr:DUF397 domain-containing protein [Micromonospora musae]
MSRLDEPVDRASVFHSARLTVEAHDAGRRCCLDCPGQACRQDEWAQKVLSLRFTAPSDRPRPAAGDRKEKTVEKLQWRTLRCDNSGPNCPEIAERDNQVFLRSSKRPERVAVLDAAEFDTLKQKILDGEL